MISFGLGLFVTAMMDGILSLWLGFLLLAKRRPVLVRPRDLYRTALGLLIPLWLITVTYTLLATPPPVDQPLILKARVILRSVLLPLLSLGIVRLSAGDVAVLAADKSMILESLSNALFRRDISHAPAKQLFGLLTQTEYAIELEPPQGKICIRHSAAVFSSATLRFSSKRSILGYSELVEELNADLKTRQANTLVGALFYLYTGLSGLAGGVVVLWFGAFLSKLPIALWCASIVLGNGP